MRIYWLNPPVSTRAIVADTAWINFSHFCQEHEWIEPIIDWSVYKTIEDVGQHILENKPDVICLSTYVWNELLCLEIAKYIKQKNKDIIIIRGGPQQTSQENIDYNCHPIGNGELYLKEALDQLQTTGKCDVQSIVKQRYNFPEESSFEYNITYLSNIVGMAKQLNKTSVVNFETTRGCPYSCTYCEWGGGIGTKISQKPIDVVMKEIDIVSVLGFTNLDIVDANFGILTRDESIIQRIADNKKIYGFPKLLLIYGMAKTSVPKREKILDIAFENDLMKSYSMSIQTLSDEALKNVKRTDIPIEDNIRMANKYHKKYGIFAMVEIILGLPGSTLKTFYDEMDLPRKTGGWDWGRSVLTVLPATELADPFYQKLHKIKTVKVGVTENDDIDIPLVSNCVLDKYKSLQEIVVQTYSYTKEEWKEMFFMAQAQKTLGPTLKETDIASVKMKEFYEDFKKYDWFKRIKAEIDLMVDGKRTDKDFLLYDGLRIEDWVKKEYIDNGLNN